MPALMEAACYIGDFFAAGDIKGAGIRKTILLWFEKKVVVLAGNI